MIGGELGVAGGGGAGGRFGFRIPVPVSLRPIPLPFSGPVPVGVSLVVVVFFSFFCGSSVCGIVPLPSSFPLPFPLPFLGFKNSVHPPSDSGASLIPAPAVHVPLLVLQLLSPVQHCRGSVPC